MKEGSRKHFFISRCPVGQIQRQLRRQCDSPITPWRRRHVVSLRCMEWPCCPCSRMKCPRENYSIHLLLFLARKPFDLFSPPAINALSSPPLRKLEDRPSDLYTKVVWTLLSLLSLSLSLWESVRIQTKVAIPAWETRDLSRMDADLRLSESISSIGWGYGARDTRWTHWWHSILVARQATIDNNN